MISVPPSIANWLGLSANSRLPDLPGACALTSTKWFLLESAVLDGSGEVLLGFSAARPGWTVQVHDVH